MAETSDVIVSPHPNHCEGITPSGAHLESRGGHLLTMRGKRIYLTQIEMEAVQTAISSSLASEVLDGFDGEPDEEEAMRAGMERAQEKLWS